MGQIVLSGTLIAGPPNGISENGFPGAQINFPLMLSGGSTGKSFGQATGILTKNVAVQAPAFGPLRGVGPDDVLAKGTFLYFKCAGPLVLRVSTDDGLGGTALEHVPIEGLYVREFPSSKWLKLLEVQGSARCEYFISGE